jgi:2-desacetyl-2-hydroxyethyl bacteriochlorophyllide A dehydrogenase
MSINCDCLVFTDKNKTEVRKLTLPDVGKGEIGVKTLYSGVSIGTELWILTGKYWGIKYPNVPGYQKVGRVDKVGAGVTNYQEGDIIFLRTTKIFSNIEPMWAGHTSYSIISADDAYIFKLPEGIEPVEASLLVLPAVGYHGAIEVMPINKNENIAVIGVGMIGQFSAQAAMLAGAKVIAVDILNDRLQFASKYANAATINPAETNVESEIKKLCPNGLDAVIDTSANPKIINESFQWLKTKGKYCFQGYYPNETNVDFLWPHIKELVMYNPTDSTPQGAAKCAQYIADGKMNIKEMITTTISFEQAPELYNKLLSGNKQIMSSVIKW